MKANDATDGLAAIGLLVLLLPAGMILTAITGTAVYGYVLCVAMLISAIRLMCGAPNAS